MDLQLNLGIDLNGARVFVHVVKSGSFSGAARTLRLPTSTVSDRVAALEGALGVTLLTRTTRKLKLTEAGQKYYTRAEGAVRELEHASEEATEERREPAGTLRITAPTDFAAHELAQAVAEYRARFSKVKVEVHQTNRLVDLVGEGFDIAVRGGPLEDSSLKARRLGAGQLVLVASRKYLDGSPALKHPRDLSGHDCVQFLGAELDPSDDTWRLRNAAGKWTQVKPRFVASATVFELLTELVAADQGVALAPYGMVADAIRDGRVVHALPEWSTEYMPVSLVYPAQKVPSLKTMEMLKCLEKWLKPRAACR